MSIAILATGDELITGDTLNTNGQQIAQALHSEGLSIGYHLTCCDELSDILASISFLAANHDTIIITGGLGPTSDDRTRFALAQFLNVALIEFEEALVHIQTRLTNANLTLNAGHHQQCLFPESARLLQNPNGTAMGCIVHSNQKQFILLPGPPRECLPMFNQDVLHALSNIRRDTHILLKWRLFAVTEGEIAHQLEKVLSGQDCILGYRLDTPYLEFKLRCLPSQAEAFKSQIDPMLAPYILCGMAKASDELRTKLAKIGQSIVIIDEVTGGLLQTTLQRPNNKEKLFFYPQPEAKLCFRLKGLDAYWSQLSGQFETSVTIDYHNDEKIGQETHKLPYRATALVLPLATEWLSLRLLHLITQLHEVVT